MNESQRRSYIALHGHEPTVTDTVGDVPVRTSPSGQMFLAVQGGTRRLPEDTEPYLRRREGQGGQLPLPSDDPGFKPTDPLEHFVRLKHPHLGSEYSFRHTGSDAYGHQIDVSHRTLTSTGVVTHEQPVGFLRWSGVNGDEDHAPGEIEGVSVHPEHRGMGISTAMWDYARAHNALHGSNEPVHSSDRSTAGNHWAHFVGGAAMPREGGQGIPEYFDNYWRH